MQPLSVAIVCKNNQSTIGAVLASVRELVRASGGEIVAIDSGSTDQTLPLLHAAGARVISSPWLGHVRTKQLALESARCPWVLMLDSDEPVRPDLALSIRTLLVQDPPRVGGCRVNRQVWYRGRPLRFAWQPEWRLRLVRAGCARWGGIDPHDKLELTPEALSRGLTTLDLAGTLRHDSFESFAEHLARQAGYARLSAQGLHARGARGSRFRLLTAGPGAFLKQLLLKQAWRDGIPGWLAAATAGAGALMKHAILLELSRAPAPSNKASADPRPTDASGSTTHSPAGASQAASPS